MNKKLNLVVDMNGCPNRCKHCWLGHMPNKKMNPETDIFLIEYFRPYFDTIVYYSWLREPDFCDNYEERWIRDNEISVGEKPQRFELASFWRIVRDESYAVFLKKAGVSCVQLTFFGMKEMTDWYVGRKGAFEELLEATEILLKYEIAPRWQSFITEENRDEIIALLELSKEMELEKLCQSFGREFQFFVHAGSADGENRKLYDIRICKEHIPDNIIPYYLDYDQIYTESELCGKLEHDNSHVIFPPEGDITLNISNELDVFYNFTHMIGKWKIGNVLHDSKEELIDRILNGKVPALEMAEQITVAELIERYGNRKSQRAFKQDDYKMYLLNRYLEDVH